MAKDIDVKEKYLELIKKYPKLPSFEDLNNNFELEYLDKDVFIAKTVRRRMNEKLIFFCRILEGILYPNPNSQINAYESSFFEEDTKNELANLYRELMILERRSLLLDVKCTEKEDVNHIIELYNKWSSFERRISELVTKIQDIWKTESKTDNDKGYFV